MEKDSYREVPPTIREVIYERNRVNQPLKWTDQLEEQLENFLIKHAFDFKAAH